MAMAMYVSAQRQVLDGEFQQSVQLLDAIVQGQNQILAELKEQTQILRRHFNTVLAPEKENVDPQHKVKQMEVTSSLSCIPSDPLYDK